MPAIRATKSDPKFEIGIENDRLITAILLAADAHKGQRDKAGEPILWHALRVGLSLLPDLDAAVVGLLHDVLEDCSLQHGERAFEFLDHPHLRETLCTLTRSKDEFYDDYIARIVKDPLARRVKLADLEDNMNPSRLGRSVLHGADVGPLMQRYLRATARLRNAEAPR